MLDESLRLALSPKQSGTIASPRKDLEKHEGLATLAKENKLLRRSLDTLLNQMLTQDIMEETPRSYEQDTEQPPSTENVRELPEKRSLLAQIAYQAHLDNEARFTTQVRNTFNSIRKSKADTDTET